MKLYRMLLVFTATALLAQAPPAREAQGAPVGQGIQALKTFLNLSDAQVKQLIELRRDEQEAVKPLREQLRTINEEFNKRAIALLDVEQKEKIQRLQNAARVQPLLRGAQVLNLLPPPPDPPTAKGADAP